MIETSASRRSQAIAAHVVTAYGRDRVAQALYEATLAGLDIGPCALPAFSDREWIRSALNGPIAAATDAALEALRRSLARSLQDAPDDLLRRLETGQRLLVLGLE